MGNILSMDLSRPHAAISPSRDLDVLKILAGTTRPLSGRQIARLSGVPASSVRVVLDRLVQHGLVRREVAGRASMFTLNRSHLAAPAAESLAGMWPELLGRLRKELKDWHPAPVHASIFGSAARRDGDVRSDIDIFLVRAADVDDETSTWRGQVDELEGNIAAWTGNRAAVVEVSEDDLRATLRSSSTFLRELRLDAVDLAGVPAHELLEQG